MDEPIQEVYQRSRIPHSNVVKYHAYIPDLEAIANGKTKKYTYFTLWNTHNFPSEVYSATHSNPRHKRPEVSRKAFLEALMGNLQKHIASVNRVLETMGEEKVELKELECVG